jgi:dihydrofolate reductase
MVEALMVRAHDGGGYVGACPDWFGGHLFGGVLIGQAVHAATRAAPEGRRIHSLHAYFLRPGRARDPIIYTVSPVRDGRSFALRKVMAHQDGKPILDMGCSFTSDTDGYDYELPATKVPDPTDPPTPAPGPWSAINLGPSGPEPDGTRRSTSRAWLKASGPLPDDPHVHAGVLGFFSDFTFTGGRPLHLVSGRPLPGRDTVVVTRQPSWSAPGIYTASSVADALKLAATLDEQIFIFGGAEIYEQTLGDADRLELTEVHSDTEGDTYSPKVDWSQWLEIARDPQDGFDWVSYVRASR